MSLDSRIAAKRAEIAKLTEQVDELLKANNTGAGDGAVRSNEELIAAGKRLDQITNLNLKIAKIRGKVNKLEDRKLIKNKILKRD